MYPEDLVMPMKKQLTDYIEKLNLDNSIINFDLKIFKKKIFVIELALRGGGNGLTDVIKYSSNLDYDKIFEPVEFCGRNSLYLYIIHVIPCIYWYSTKYNQ